jgi:hypothetical protein
MSFIGIYYPLTDIAIVHIVYINETIPPPPRLCDAVGGAFYYLLVKILLFMTYSNSCFFYFL